MSGGEKDGDENLSPDAAFAVLGNETRIEILRTLWEVTETIASDGTITFSELYEHGGFEDTGNFNYHLGKLTDHFVRRTDGGYELTGAGLAVVRAVIAGTVDERPTLEFTEIDAGCPLCAAPVEVAYESQGLIARCSRCAGLWQKYDDLDGLLFWFPLPPAGLADRTPEEAFHTVITYFLQRIRSFRRGVCPTCSGPVDESIDVCEAHEPGEHGGCPRCSRRHLVEVTCTCRVCRASTNGPLTIAILVHPAVTAFYYEHDIEHRFASWASFQRGQTMEEELVSTDPLRIRVTIPCDDTRLRLVLDETAAVVDAEREAP